MGTLCQIAGVEMDHGDRRHLEGLVAKTCDQLRLTTTRRRVAAAAGVLQLHLIERCRRFGPVGSIRWVGRRCASGSVADIGVCHVSGAVTLYSQKTVANGCGTARNLGLSSHAKLIQLTGVDVACHADAMWSCTAVTLARRWTGSAGPDPVAAKMTRAALARRASDDDRAMVKREVQAKQIQEAAARDIATQLSAADPSVRRELARMLTGSSEADMFVVVMTDAGTMISCAPALGDAAEVAFLYESGPALTMTIDGRPAVRLQVGCTNAMGLSPLCLRAFMR